MNNQEVLEKTISDLEFMRRIIDVDILDAYGVYIGSGTCDDFLKIIDSAIALLKAQEPVEPVFERIFMSDIEIYDCGKCGTSLGAKGITKYCMNCGRAVKWE